MTIPTNSTAEPAPQDLPGFDAMPLSEELRRAIGELGYTHPTPVQQAVFEPASRGHDLVVQARTGTGKTASFGLPLVDSLVRRNQPSTQALILCPTRELALQVHRELEALSKYRSISVVAIYGGAPMSRQIEQLKTGAQIVVGTPGRVLDHLQRETLSPSQIRVCILDESDEMLSMGFLPQITEILTYLPSPHQTLLFSATLPPDIQRIAETRLKEPVFLTLSGDHIGALEVQHLTYFSMYDKLDDLLRLIEVEDPESAIIFCNTKDETKRVAGALDKRGYSAEWLNADLAQSDREKVMESTRRSHIRFLVCTDVASRGIDISHLTHVINFDFPESPEAYVHRTGRTGRAGRTGTAISLVTPGDIGFLYMLRLTYKIVPIERQLPTKAELRTREELDLVQMFAQAFESRNHHADDIMLARRLLTHESVEAVVAGLLRDHLGTRSDANASASETRRSRLPKPLICPSPPKAKSADGAALSDRQPKSNATRIVNLPSEPSPPEATLAADRETASSRAKPKPGSYKPTLEATTVAEPIESEFEFKYTVGGSDPKVLPLDQIGLASEPRIQVSKDKYRAQPSERNRSTDDTREIFVGIGRRDGVGSDEVLALLTRNAIPRSAVLYVNVRHHHTFVGIRESSFEAALRTLDGSELSGRTTRAEPARSGRD